MKYSTVCLATILVASCHTLAPAQWDLVWSDEFSGTTIDSSRWTHEVNAQGGGNNELQYYTARPENSFIDNGVLVLRAIKETYTSAEGTRQYTSARINSRYKGDWRYGRIEARAKMPLGQGLWPAIWMLPSDWLYGGWAASGEIDIMEYRGNEPNRVLGTLHYGGAYPANTHTGDDFTGPDFSADFHVFALEWDEMEFRWYVDGALYQTQNNWYSTNGEYPAPFDERFHMILNLAVGGNFLPNPPPDADYFPQDLRIDWVRVYRRQSTPYAGAAMAIPGRIQAELYNRGGNGVAYSDESSAQRGSGFRQKESVDIEACTDAGGGYNIGWVEPGEWMDYSVTAANAGAWTVDLRAASLGVGGILRIRVRDGLGAEVASVPLTVPNTGGWQAWATITSESFPLPAGNLNVRAEIEAGEFNMNWIELIQSSTLGTDMWILN